MTSLLSNVAPPPDDAPKRAGSQGAPLFTVHTRQVLLDQTPESRLANIELEILKQLEMQGYASSKVSDADRLDELGIVGTSRERLALTIARVFPFMSAEQAAHQVNRATTVGDLIRSIFEKVGPSCPPSQPHAPAAAKPSDHSGHFAW